MKKLTPMLAFIFMFGCSSELDRCTEKNLDRLPGMLVDQIKRTCGVQSRQGSVDICQLRLESEGLDKEKLKIRQKYLDDCVASLKNSSCVSNMREQFAIRQCNDQGIY